MLNARAHCDILGISLSLDPPSQNYEHSWAQDCHDARRIFVSRKSTSTDRTHSPTTLTLDLFREESPLIVGLDVTQHANLINLSNPGYIDIKRPCDSRTLSMYTYISADMPIYTTRRLGIEIAPHRRSPIPVFTGNTNSEGNKKLIKFSSKPHRYMHLSMRSNTSAKRPQSWQRIWKTPSKKSTKHATYVHRAEIQLLGKTCL